jgi:hypothetical protein
VSDCCLTPNDQYENLDISKNSGKPYKNTNFDKEDPLTACTIVVIPIDSSFAEQVEEYTCLNTDSSEILVSNIA